MPNGIIKNSYKPFVVIKADFSIVDVSSGICHYLFVRSIVPMYLAKATFSIILSMDGIG